MYPNINNIDFAMRLLVWLSLAALVLIASDAAFASGAAGGAAAGGSSTSGDDVIGSTLCRLVGNLTGGIAKSIATIAIFAVGVSLFLGKINWGVAAATAAGVGIIFGAGKLVAWLSGNTDNSNCPTS